MRDGMLCSIKMVSAILIRLINKFGKSLRYFTFTQRSFNPDYLAKCAKGPPARRKDVILEREKMAYQIEEKNPLPSGTPSALSCYALRLKPGQEIKECLLAFVKNENLKAPFVLSCVGSVSQATLRLANAVKDNTNEVIQVQGRHEIVSLVGTLAGAAHLHTSLSDQHGHVIGGHVMGNMIVFTTAEVVIGNCDTLSFTREMDYDTGFDELVVKES
ncbi:bifunctional protein GlmU-like isoform X1 [Montipora capricornis]|uniref:bifunctional protein GlmU-like isoform X2 n=1 Tax=Montipora foliosa TaxID=591990 RepID=UPI0035F1FC3E